MGAAAVEAVTLASAWEDWCDWVRATAHCWSMNVMQAATSTTRVVTRPTPATRAWKVAVGAGAGVPGVSVMTLLKAARTSDLAEVS